ncbi:hypothetical protein J3459_017159 [Metarhizium acridum]|nr:hypothetical protein J3459_017159 [Metarhizium acridum]
MTPSSWRGDSAYVCCHVSIDTCSCLAMFPSFRRHRALSLNKVNHAWHFKTAVLPDPACFLGRVSARITMTGMIRRHGPTATQAQQFPLSGSVPSATMRLGSNKRRHFASWEGAKGQSEPCNTIPYTLTT